MTTAGGIITSLSTVGLNLLLTNWLNLDLLSVSHLFVIPTGGILGGAGAASGYYLAARLTQTMPSKKVLWNMLLVGASTWALVKWIPYQTLTLEDGTAVSDVVSFWEFIKVTAASTELLVGSTRQSTGELGSLGYVREVLQLIGFSIGGFATYALLSKVEACVDCRRYAKTENILENTKLDRLASVLEAAQVSLPDLAREAAPFAALGPRVSVRFRLTACRCPKCAKEWLRPSVTTVEGQSTNTHKFSASIVDPAQTAALRRHAAAQPPQAGGAKAA